ncbi:probable disease resistance protein At1g52660 [Amaranthus tricolor]|uniref:probable disease resistance protein At1g52660 n=1 Tax=Amaranthus tricolor TaxID=29722 RepID=UPI00258A32E4|nr:probable disease resistance protein At1g52660 [Amaranthus tricolor]
MAMIIQNWMIGDTTIDDELQLLRSKKQGLCALVDDLNIQLEADEMQPGKKRKRVVGNWLKNVEELLIEVQYFDQDVERGLFSSTKKLKREVLSLEREMEDLMEQGKFPGGLTLDDHACSSVPLVTTNLKAKLFEENMKMILSWLLNEDLCRIGVYGLGGVGKTTLAKHIHNKLLEGAKTSMHIYWVTVSQENTIATLQNKIAKAAKVEHILLQDDDDTKRAANLYAALKKRKKVVLFLDDMWKNFEVEKVGIPVGKDECRRNNWTRDTPF